MKTYKTAEVASIIGVHPNTVRLYESCELIPVAARDANTHRLFTEFHIKQFQLARKVLEVEVLQNGLRKKAIEIIKLSAKGAFDQAIELTESYLEQIKEEQFHAEVAITIVHIMLSPKNGHTASQKVSLTRKETATHLQVSIDTLRNWELNGLLKVKRKENGYRMYTETDIEQLKIIRVLRCANYSLSAILRMLNALTKDPKVDIAVCIDTPSDEDEIISVCDRLLSSLKHAEKNGKMVLEQLCAFKNNNSYPTL